MNHSSVKKQNRVLLITLVIILLAAAVLIALTGGANKKEKEENPPVDTKISEESSSDSSSPTDGNSAADDNSATENSGAKTDAASEDVLKKPDSEKSNKTAEAETVNDEKKVEETEKAEKTDASEDNAAEVSVIQSGVMPTFTLPVDAPVLKGYSGETPVFSYTMNDYRTHSGIDFVCAPGTPVLAAADGVICEVTDDPMMGVCVGISHTGGAVTRYCGLSEESLDLMTVGEEIRRGQPIGTSGPTSLIESAEEDHVHFELVVNGSHENPADFMKVQYLSEMVED